MTQKELDHWIKEQIEAKVDDYSPRDRRLYSIKTAAVKTFDSLKRKLEIHIRKLRKSDPNAKIYAIVIYPSGANWFAAIRTIQKSDRNS